MAEMKVVVLRCSDGADVEVKEEEAVAMMSTTIRRPIEGGCDSVIELTDISSATLDKVIEYCNKHTAAASKDWETDFINSMDDTTISHVNSALNYLEVKGLQQLSMSNKLVSLCSCDHQTFVVERPIALKLKTVRLMLQAQTKCANRSLMLPNVTSAMLVPVLEFYRKHSWAETEALSEAKINEMNQEFVKLYARRSFVLIRAASYLEARTLLELMVDTVKAVPRLAALASADIVTKVVGCHYTKDEENAMMAELSNILA